MESLLKIRHFHKVNKVQLCQLHRSQGKEPEFLVPLLGRSEGDSFVVGVHSETGFSFSRIATLDEVSYCHEYALYIM